MFTAAEWDSIYLNVVSNIPFLLLDLAIIALIIPVWSWYFGNYRWRKIRAHLIQSLAADLRQPIEILNYYFKSGGDEYRKDHIDSATLLRHWEDGFSKVDPRLRELGSRIESSIGIYSAIMSPKIVAALIVWRQRLSEFENALRELAFRSWQASPATLDSQGATWRVEFFASVTALNDATNELLEKTGNPTRSDRGMEANVSYLPLDLLDEDMVEYWMGGVEDARRRFG